MASLLCYSSELHDKYLGRVSYRQRLSFQSSEADMLRDDVDGLSWNRSRDLRNRSAAGVHCQRFRATTDRFIAHLSMPL